jgi:hypothetical protein
LLTCVIPARSVVVAGIAHARREQPVQFDLLRCRLFSSSGRVDAEASMQTWQP